MKRRSGISDKSTTQSATCQTCSLVLSDYICYICKRRICCNCISEDYKYCFICSSKVPSNEDNTIIRIPTNPDIDNDNDHHYIRVKNKKKYCCFF